MSDSDAAEEHGQPAAPAGILFTDHFAGTTESLPHIPLLPDEQAALVQVTRPLQLMRAAKWFVGRRWPAAGRQRLRQQPLPPLDCVRDGCAARVPARAMFGWVATACGRLASAPGDGTTWRLAGWVMECVSRGGVRRVQVQPQRRAAVSRHMCVFCNRLLQQTLADVQVAHCKAPQQHAPRCRTPCFPAHALFAVCRRRQPRTLRCARQTRGERSPALNLRAQRLAPDPPPSCSSIRALSTPAPTFMTSMDRPSFKMAKRPLISMPGLKLLQATPAMLKWRTRMRGEVGA